MRILKSHPLLKLVNSYLVDSNPFKNKIFIQNNVALSCLGHYYDTSFGNFNVVLVLICICSGILIIYGLIKLYMNPLSEFFAIRPPYLARTMPYPSARNPRATVDIRWTDTQINLRTVRVVYDHNQNTGLNLRLLYPRPSYRDITVTVNGRDYDGLILGAAAFLNMASFMNYIEPNLQAIWIKRPNVEYQKKYRIVIVSRNRPIMLTSSLNRNMGRYIVVFN